MTYATLDSIRDLTGITADEVSSTILGTIRDRAENKLLKDLTIEVKDEEMDSNLDGDYLNGDNATFYTKNKPIADSNKDKTIDSNDITIYLWTDVEDETTRTEASIDNVRASTGRVVLSSAPSSNNEKITVTYSYYLSEEVPDWNTLELASIYLSGHFAVVKLRGKQPVKYTVGDFKYDDDRPGRVFLLEYKSIINNIKPKMGVLSSEY